MQENQKEDVYQNTIIGIVLLVYDLAIFSIFMYHYIKKKTKVTIVELTMSLLLLRSFRFYIYLLSINDQIDKFKRAICKMMNFMCFGVLADYDSIIQSIIIKNLNNLIQFHYLETILIELFYCWEYIHIALHPLDQTNKRKIIYIFVSFIALILCYIFTVKSEIIEMTENVFVLEIIDYIIKFVYFLVGILSIILLLRQITISIKHVKCLKLYISIRHGVYVVLYFCLCLLVFFHRRNDKYKINPNIFLIISGLIEVLIEVIRLSELNIINFKTKKNKERITDIAYTTLIPSKEKTESEMMTDFEITTDNYSMRNSSFLNDLISHEDKITIQTLDSAVVSESIYLILEGILHLAQVKDIKSSLYDVKIETCDTIIHEYIIRNNNLTQIISTDGKDSNILKNCCSIFTNKVSLIEYYPKYFTKIWKIENLTTEKMLHSFNILLNKANLQKICQSEGKSGSMFFFTFDKKFIIKTIPARELNSMKKIIKPYCEYLSLNKHSLLVKIFGVFTLNMGLSEIHLILMENVAPYSSNKIKLRFDLKGSVAQRETKDLAKNMKTKTLKDLDYLYLKSKSSAPIVSLSKGNVNFVLEIIKKDIKLLQHYNLIDYSLFLSIVEEKIPENYENFYLEIEEANSKQIVVISREQKIKYTYCISIIDFLTEYNFRKKFERLWKSFSLSRNKSRKISVNKPSHYYLRFLQFMRDNVFTVNDQIRHS